MIKVISKKDTSVIRYGIIKIDTRIGVIEYSYQTGVSGVDFDNNYQVENKPERYEDLTDEELDTIDDLISDLINE